jgi:hypothetical protein
VVSCVVAGFHDNLPVGRSGSSILGDEVDPEDEDLDEDKGALFKRKDFLGIEEEGGLVAGQWLHARGSVQHVSNAFPAKLHPSRTYYYRKSTDVDKLIEQCTRKVIEILYQIRNMFVF